MTPGDMDVTGQGYYTLDDDNNLVPATSLLAWARWFETSRARRIVKQEEIGPYRVSTVFLGLDHSFSILRDVPPRALMIFETMVFNTVGNDATDIQERCATWREAEEQHADVAERIRKAISG